MHTRLEIEPEYADALRAAGLADFDALFNTTPSGPPTSRHRHRETVPIEFDVNGKRQRFFLKRVFKVPGQHSWRPWLRGKPGYSQPVREWDNIKMMREAGLPVMKRVAVGERRKFGIPMQAFILVEDVGMQWTLENWLIPGFPAPPNVLQSDKKSLWFELGKLQSFFREANVDWPDVHAKHIFAENEPTGDSSRWKLALIDVERARFAPGAYGRNWVHSAAPTHVICVRASTNVRYRRFRNAWAPFWQSLAAVRPDADEYGAYGDGLTGNKTAVKCDWTPTKTPWLFRHVPIVLPDSYIHPRANSVRWQDEIKAADCDRAMLEAIGIKDVQSAFALTNAHNLHKQGLQRHRDRLKLLSKDDKGGEVALYVKRYREPPIKEQLRRMREADRSHSSAYREYTWARRLLELGIPTMRPIAVGEEMSGWWEQRSFSVAAAVEGESLETITKRWQALPDSRPSTRYKWELIERVAHLVGRLHNNFFFHRDLYLSHIFLSQNSAGKPILQLIDLARMLHRVSWSSWQRWEIKDLAALAYSVPKGLLTRTDHLRFLRARGFMYFLRKNWEDRIHGHAGTDRSELLDVIRRVNRRVAKMAKHDAKRAARLGIPQDTSNRPLAGSTNTQTAQSPTE